MVIRKLDTGPIADVDRRIRQEWAQSIQAHLDEWVNPDTGHVGMTRKEFQHRLASAGCEVSQQTISLWLNGKATPRPSAQIAIGRAVGAPARSVFPLAVAA